MFPHPGNQLSRDSDFRQLEGDVVGYKSDRVAEAFLLRQAQQFRQGKRRIAPEILGDVLFPIGEHSGVTDNG